MDAVFGRTARSVCSGKSGGLAAQCRSTPTCENNTLASGAEAPSYVNELGT